MLLRLREVLSCGCCLSNQTRLCLLAGGTEMEDAGRGPASFCCLTL